MQLTHLRNQTDTVLHTDTEGQRRGIGTGADKDRTTQPDKDRMTQTKMTQTKQHGDDTDKETRGLDQDRHKRYTDKDAARHSDSKVSLKTNP